MAYDHQMIETNGVTLHVVQAGPPDGPLVILLHGFPEFWYGWRHQIDALADRGFRVWAPDQRGYHLSDKPAGTAAYNLDLLAADIIGLIDAAGQEQVFLAGHDWGANVAWWTAIKYPQRLKKLAILNVPHPEVFMEHVRRPKQLLKSWYVFFFQIPRLPEMLMSLGNYNALRRAMRGSGQPGTFSDDNMTHYLRAWSQPGAVTGMLNWYRAIMRVRPGPVEDTQVHVPTLMLWGAQDVALTVEMARPSIERCDEGQLVVFEDATHWVQHDKAAEVSQMLGDFFSAT